MVVTPESLPAMALVMLVVPELTSCSLLTGDGSQHALLLLHAVADDDHVFDLVGLFGESHRQRRGVDNGDFPRLVPQERDVE